MSGTSKPHVPKRAAGLILNSTRLDGKDVSGVTLTFISREEFFEVERNALFLCALVRLQVWECQVDGRRGVIIDRSLRNITL